MSRRLPPLSALRAFEAAARCGSFKRAAAELGVTPAAVSHQIRALEDYVGLTLFERRTRHVVLTEAGMRLYPVLRSGFDEFAGAVEKLTHQRRSQVTISATIAFTACWLIPRVTAFRAVYPDIDLQLQASDDVVDLQAAGVDIAIRYGTGPYPGFTVTPLFTDRFAPVFNPLLEVASISDFARWPRIDFQWRRQRPDNPTWHRWFSEAGLAEPAESTRLSFSDESHAIRATVAGHGIALLSTALVRDELMAGQLVQPFGPSLIGFCHHVLTRPGESADPVIAAVEWLKAEAAVAEPPRSGRTAAALRSPLPAPRFPASPLPRFPAFRFPTSRLPAFPPSRLPAFPPSRLPAFPPSRFPAFPLSGPETSG